METLTTLHPPLAGSTLEGVKDLVQANLTLSSQLTKAAEVVRAEDARELFDTIAETRRGYALTLQRDLGLTDVDPEREGGRVVQTVRLLGQQIVREATRDDELALRQLLASEQRIEGAYHRVVRSVPGSPLNSTLSHQLRSMADQQRSLERLIGERAFTR